MKVELQIIFRPAHIFIFYLHILFFYQITAKCGINNCTKCEKAINQCLDCKSNYYYNHRWKRCTKCVDNCNVCMNTQECYRCQKNYYVDNLRQCSYCSPNCNYCTNSSNCDECEQGYYYLIEGRQCIIQCPENCLKCKNENTCYRCEIGHYLKNNICKKCSHKCQVCVSKLDCSTCVVNYYWNDKIKTCTLCDSNCAENHCDQYFGCTLCNKGYLRNDNVCIKCVTLNSTKCNKCITNHFGHFWDTRCKKCEYNCLKCNDLEDCGGEFQDFCVEKSAFNTVLNRCTSCTGFLQDASAIKAGSVSCHKCDGLYYKNDKCLNCKSVNTISSNIECKRCGGIHSNYTLSSYWSQGTTCKYINCETYTLAYILITVTDPDECHHCFGYYFDQNMNVCTVLKDTEGCIYSGVNVERLSSEKCERCENRYMNLPGDDICEEVVDCNNADWNPESSIHCAHYWDPYNLKCQPLDCDDQIRIDQEYKCNACNNRYWDTTRRKCLIVNCYNVDIILGTRYYNLCYGCRRLGFYWDVNFNQCRVIYDYNANCHTGQTIENICDMCEGHRWDGTSCVAVNCDGATDIENDEYRCKFCYGKEYILPGPVIAALPCTFGGNYYIDGCYGLVLNPGTSFFELNYQDIMGFCSVNEIVSRILGSHYWNGDECYFSETYHCNVYSNANHCNCMTRLFRPANVCIEMECNVSYLNDIGNTMVRKSATEYCATLKTGIHYNPGAELSKNSNCQNPGLIEVPDECNSCLGLVWEVDYCTVLVCSIQPLNTEDKCLGCDMFFKPISNTCYVCTANSINCNADGAECKDNYIFERKTWTCIAAICNETADETNCNACDNFFWNVSVCEACADNCTKCVNLTSCDQCLEYHVWSHNQDACVLCYSENFDDCTQCSIDLTIKYFDTDENLCHQCENWTLDTLYTWRMCDTCGPMITTASVYWDDQKNFCAECIPDCLECSDISVCTLCVDGKYLQKFTDTAGQCIDCMKKCKRCDTDTNCLLCDDGYYFNTLNSRKECLECPMNCLLCDNGNTCNKCEDQRFEDIASGRCLSCIENCLECDTKNRCIQCQRGHFKNELKAPFTCDECSIGCEECESITQCSKCFESYCLNQHNQCSNTIGNCNICQINNINPTTVTCLYCNDKYTLKTCAPCPPECESCYDLYTCNSCKSSYFLESGKCKPCPNFCGTCASNVTCTDCVSKDMWYDNIVNECGVCAYKCIKCKDLFHCLICDENRYLLDGKCHECPNNCKECTAHNNCSKCLRNNMIYNSSTNKCTVCDQYCQSCKSVKLCNICEPSAFMTKTKPKQCSKCSTEIDNCNLCSRDWIDRVRCDECIAEFTPNKDKTKCIECGVGCKLCKYQKEMCTECAKSFHLSENSEQCGPKRCFSCDETEKSDCYYNAATYGLNGCIGDCMTFRSKDNVIIQRSCRQYFCHFANFEKWYCHENLGKEICELCCKGDKCNNIVSSSNTISFSILVCIIILLINYK